MKVDVNIVKLGKFMEDFRRMRWGAKKTTPDFLGCFFFFPGPLDGCPTSNQWEVHFFFQTFSFEGSLL